MLNHTMLLDRVCSGWSSQLYIDFKPGRIGLAIWIIYTIGGSASTRMWISVCPLSWVY